MEGEGILDSIASVATTVGNAVDSAANTTGNIISYPARKAKELAGKVINKAIDVAKGTFTAERFPGERHAREGPTGRPYNFVGKLFA